MERTIIIKNDDISSITYSDGDWSTVQASVMDDFGSFGPALSPTLHRTTTTGSFSFSFQGTSVNVIGSINITDPSTNPDPTWECSVDGKSLGAPNISPTPENNWSLCSMGDIPSGSHQLVVNVISKGMPFYFDYIEYQPSPNVSLQNAFIRVNGQDSAIEYISGWTGLEGTANQTTDPGGLMMFTFIGVGLSWYGRIPTEESHTASSAEYTIDDMSSVSFTLPGLPPNANTTILNQLFFITPTLEMGSHTLSARYTGSPGQTPLTLGYLVVTNGSFPTNDSLPPINSPSPHPPLETNSSSLLPNSHSQTSSHTGAIIGGVVGGIGGLIICAIIFFLWYKRGKHRQDYETSRLAIVDPFQSQPVTTAINTVQDRSYSSKASNFTSNQPETAVLLSNPISHETHPSVPSTGARVHIQTKHGNIRPLPQQPGVVEFPPVYSE